MSLIKPQTEVELLPPLDAIGEPGWESRLRAWLTEFDFRFGEPSTEAEVAEAELRLGVRLPEDWRMFLLAFGPLDLESVRLTPPAQITPLNDVWFKSHLSESDRAMLFQFLQVGECSSGNYIGWNTIDGWVCECCHDPGGLWDWCPSFSELIRLSLVRLWCGYYGWPDDSVQQLSERLARRWLTAWKQRRPT